MADKDSQIINKLSCVGLTELQGTIYLTLLRMGPSFASTVASFLGIGRVNCYDSLSRLQEKGLISYYIDGKKRVYQAVDANQLLTIIEDLEQDILEKRANIESVIVELNNQTKRLNHKSSEEIFVFRGTFSQKGFFEMILREIERPSEILILSGTGKALEELPVYFPQWHRKRAEKNIKVRVLFNSHLKGKTLTQMPLSSIRFLSESLSAPTTTFIFGDFVATLHWGQKPVTFVTCSHAAAQSFRKYFSGLWKLSK